MSEQYRVDTRKLGQFNPWRCHAREKVPELIVEIWICENTNVAELQ
jgi:hypothetical protein